MGYIIGFFLIALAIFLAGGLAGRLTAPDRKVRKADLQDARRTISSVQDIVTRYRYPSQLDLVGRAMADEIREETNDYWRGIKL